MSSEPPTKPLFLWEFSRSRLKISSKIENLKRKLEVFKRSSEIAFFSRPKRRFSKPALNRVL